MRARAAALFTSLFCCNLFCFAAASPASPPATPPDDKPVHIGVLFDSLKSERWQRDAKLIQSRAHELGVKITFKDAEGSDDLQIQQANQLLEAGVTVLIVVPH